MKIKHPQYLNIYAITRHYGGPEEGGWWYNWWHCEASIHVAYTDTAEQNQIKLLIASAGYQDEGDIYSVNGGIKYKLLLEETKAESESTKRPIYE